MNKRPKHFIFFILFFSALFLGWNSLSLMPPYYQGPVSDHFNGREFFDPENPFDVPWYTPFKWMLQREKGPWPEWVEQDPQPAPPERVLGSELRVTFINHATVLIQTQGLNILTDPVWSKVAGPSPRFGAKRVHEPGVAFKNLPPIDWIWLSHSHYDHLDLPTLRRLQEAHQPQLAAGLGTDAFLAKKIPELEVVAMDWQDKIDLGEGLQLHFLPAQHWSARTPWDRNKMLWGAFALEAKSGSVYFGGDTGYSDHFKRAGEQFGSFRIALLPIGDYRPRWFMEYAHMNVEEAFQAQEDLNAEKALGIHHGTFPLADTGYQEVFEELRHQQKVKNASVETLETFRFLKPGEAWDID